MIQATREFKLDQELLISYNGVNDKIDTLTMYAPTSQTLKYSAPLKQIFYRAMAKLRSSNPEEVTTQKATEGKELTGDAILIMLYMYGDNINELIDRFRELCIAGAVKASNGANLTTTLLDKLSAKEMEGLMGEYLKNFMFG